MSAALPSKGKNYCEDADHTTGSIFPDLFSFPVPIQTERMTLLALLLLILLPQARCETSLHAFIAAAHKTAFDSFNVLVLGDLSVAKAAFRGPLAVQGRADLSDFDISLSRSCNRDNRAVTVGGSLSARMGTIHGGYTVLGKGSSVHHSVKMECTSRVERYDPLRNGDMEFGPMRERLIRENAEMCVSKSLPVEPVNETMTFRQEGETFSCYDYFRVKTADLRLVQKWVYEGDYDRNVVIMVSGLRHEFREFRMLGFNPKKTLVVFCAIYGNFGLYNTRFSGSLMGPTSSFVTMDTIVNGSLIVGALRGSMASLDVPYHTC